jgi:hypothetical protein
MQRAEAASCPADGLGKGWMRFSRLAGGHGVIGGFLCIHGIRFCFAEHRAHHCRRPLLQKVFVESRGQNQTRHAGIEVCYRQLSPPEWRITVDYLPTQGHYQTEGIQQRLRGNA